MNTTTSNIQNTRYPIVDQLRGLAVLLMIIFHLSYDLNLFGFVKIDFFNSSFWYGFPRVIVFLFLFCVGLSLPIVNIPHIKWKKFWKRTGKIAFFAIIISVTTYIMFPTRWIYFGTLHCIGLTSIMALPFLKRAYLSLILFLGLIIPSVFWNLNIPWINLGHKSMDYISPFPWVGVVTLGIFAFHMGFHKMNTAKIPLMSPLVFMGKEALIIYLLHQPILYGTVYGVYLLTNI